MVAEQENAANEIRDRGLGFWNMRSFRFHLTSVLCLGILAMSTVRNALGMAMVCMVNSTAVNEMEAPDADELYSENETASADGCPMMTESFVQDYDGNIVWSTTEQGVVFSAIYWGGVVAGIPIGWLTNRYSPKWMIMGGFVILLASCLLSPVAAIRGGVIPTFIVRFVQGMCSQVLFTPSSTMIISYWVPMDERSTAMSLTTSGNQIAMIIGPPTNAWLCQEKHIAGGWPSIFYANGFFILIAAVVWWIFVNDQPDTSRWISENEKRYIETCLGTEAKELKEALKSSYVPWKQVWTSMCLWSCYFCAFANGLMTATLTSYIPTYYKEVLHLDLTSSGLLSATPFLAQWIAKVTFSILADLLKRRTKINHTFIVKSFNNLGTFGVGFALIALGYMKCSQPVLAVFFMTLANALYSGLVPGYITSLVCIAPTLNGIANGITRFVGQVASVIAPYIVGSVTVNGTAGEWRIVFYIMAACMFFSGAMFLIFGTAEIPDWAAEEAMKARQHETQSGTNTCRNSQEPVLPPWSAEEPSATEETSVAPSCENDGSEGHRSVEKEEQTT